MDITAILISASLGAVGGGVGFVVGSILAKRFENKNLRVILIVSFAVVLPKIGERFIDTQSLQNWISPPPKIEVASSKFGDTLGKDKEYLEEIRGMTTSEATHYTQSMVSKGKKRLSLKTLLVWNDTRAQLADQNRRICAGFWTGQLEPDLIQTELEKLSPMQLDGWFSFTLEAYYAERNQVAFENGPDENTVSDVLAGISEDLEGEQKARFERIMQGEQGISEEDNCWIMKTIFERIKVLEQLVKEQFLRAIAN